MRVVFITLMEGTKERTIFLERTSVNFDVSALQGRHEDVRKVTRCSSSYRRLSLGLSGQQEGMEEER